MPEIPENNAFSKERWVLGKKLFFDKRLSADSSISCGSCHKPSHAFADIQATTPGIQGRPGFRNVPSLTNVAYHPYFLREGSVPTLEMQVLVPVSEHNEFGFNMALLVERLSRDETYQKLSHTAYNRPLDAFVITRALANFQRSLLSGDSRFDRYLNGYKTALNAQEKEGMALFFSSRTNCASCHEGFNFTHYGFANNGLYMEYPDSGRYRLTRKETDLAMFKIPGLRNLGYTAPYMHDGSLKTIDDVLTHYNSGGNGHTNQSSLIQPLHLKQEELQALKAFLLSLNDESFVRNMQFRE
jgi:cytochrome c peroxidase